MISISALVDCFQTLLQSYIRYDRRGCPEIRVKAGSMFWHPYSVCISLSFGENAMTLHKPFFRREDSKRLVINPIFEKLEEGRVPFYSCL